MRIISRQLCGTVPGMRTTSTLAGRTLYHPLRRGLVALWRLEETSGSAVDSALNGLTLSPSASVPTGAPGKLGFARNFASSSSQQLSRASVAALPAGDTAFTISAWIRPTATALSGNGAFISRHNSSSEWQWYALISSDVMRFRVTPTGTNTGLAQATSAVTLVANTWYHVLLDHDPVTDTIGVRVNNGTRATDSMAGGLPANNPSVRIGGLAASNFWDGLIDEAAIWTRLLSDHERKMLYSNGRGLRAPW